MKSLTRKEFYDLADRCRQEAMELARHDQSRVDLAQCRRFNEWLAQVKRYEQLAPHLSALAPARPINRWMVLGGTLLLWLLGILFLGRQLGTDGLRLLSIGAMGTFILLLFLPERFYGTTIELLEGKVLRIVEALEALLQSQSMGLSEAAYFRIKENLEAARRELRQQIHLAHQ